MHVPPIPSPFHFLPAYNVPYCRRWLVAESFSDGLLDQVFLIHKAKTKTSLHSSGFTSQSHLSADRRDIRENGHWLQTQTGAGGTVTLAWSFFFFLLQPMTSLTTDRQGLPPPIRVSDSTPVQSALLLLLPFHWEHMKTVNSNEEVACLWNSLPGVQQHD